MVCCSAVNCSNRTEDGYKLYRLPRETERREKWILNVKRKDWLPGPAASLCHCHFEDDQFESRRVDGKIKLKPNAIPTLFNLPKPHPDFNAKRIKILQLRENDIKIESINKTQFLADHLYCNKLKCEPPSPDITTTATNDDINPDDFLADMADDSELVIRKNKDSNDENIVVEVNPTCFLKNVADVPQVESRKTSEDSSAEGILLQNTDTHVLEDIMQKKPRNLLARNNLLNRKLALLYRQLSKSKKMMITLSKEIRTVFHEDQINVLKLGHSRGVTWSEQTINDAFELLSVCGRTGYQLLLSKKFPFPSLRTLRRKRLLRYESADITVLTDPHVYEDANFYSEDIQQNV